LARSSWVHAEPGHTWHLGINPTRPPDPNLRLARPPTPGRVRGRFWTRFLVRSQKVKGPNLPKTGPGPGPGQGWFTNRGSSFYGHDNLRFLSIKTIVDVGPLRLQLLRIVAFPRRSKVLGRSRRGPGGPGSSSTAEERRYASDP
jgi:hypothetical protein